MSSAFKHVSDMTIDHIADTFLDVYYREAIADISLGNKTVLEIDWMDVFRWDENEANEIVGGYGLKQDVYAQAASRVGIPHPVNPDKLTVAFTNLPDRCQHTPIDARRDDIPETIVGIRGDLAKATVPAEELTRAAFVCKRDHYTFIPVLGDELPNAPKCVDGCEGARTTLDIGRSEFNRYQKIRIETPPGESGELQDDHIDAEIRGELVWHGSDVGLLGRTGDAAIVYGTLEREQQDANGKLFSRRLNAEWVEFDTDQTQLQPGDYLDQIRELAKRDDCFELWKESLVPELYATEAWDVGLELLLTYLAGAPRVDIPNGPTFRGDIHILIISGYGMGKSMVNEAIASYSPKCINESVTGLKSDVGLLAAAVEDDFGGSQWTLQPGVLVRGNGGHVILDEIDKTDADLERMNDALEGQQVVDINKAGQTASFDSKVGLLATGNPDGDRFDPNTPKPQQVPIEGSLLSRFDGTLLMEDIPDIDTDRNIAKTSIGAYIEALEYETGERNEFEQLDRPIGVELGRNWIHYARDNYRPIPTQEQADHIAEWYSTELRTLNQHDNDAPVPANARHAMATLRRAMAYARLSLSNTVLDEHVERAMDVQKKLQNWNGEHFEPVELSVSTQRESVHTLKQIIRDEGKIGHNDLIQSAKDAGIDVEKAEHRIEKLKKSGDIMQPSSGTYKVIE